ncbi:uncharacterized protein LOC133184916 [Saccostrea echinata]|uniref:uncharacterized protein LOC133184916 n=1 Tax=Saccostrea echinata TaxID=191078 RepID=UPI002A7F3B60|nr:uncharacterized protein LOC133184916 [Saccostrea echinata]
MAVDGIGLSAVLCELCENEPAQSFCRTCSGNLCEKCATEHKGKKIFHRHDVVKMALTRKMEIDGFGYCREHPESRYELCCQECTVPVCTKCIAGPHNGHKMTDIPSVYMEAKSKITSKVNEIETSQYLEHRKNLDDLDNFLSDINRQTNNLEKICSLLNVDIAWIRGGQAEIKKMNIQGNELATVKTLTKDGRPSGLIELDDGSIFYSDIDNKQVKKLSKDLQEEEKTKLDWHPMGLCISRSGHILVCTAFLSGEAVDPSDRGKVLRMSYKGLILQEIEKDGEEKNLYSRPICISENINQDICVSDVFRYSIIVVDRSGFFRFAYSGGGIHESREDFWPTELDTDSMGNIAVSDNRNNLVHLLDIDGNLVKYLLTSSDGISEPRGLKVDIEDRLWVTEVRTGYVKIFKYLD